MSKKKRSHLQPVACNGRFEFEFNRTNPKMRLYINNQVFVSFNQNHWLVFDGDTVLSTQGTMIGALKHGIEHIEQQLGNNHSEEWDRIHSML